ncbi:MAG TPA: hypothetical protein VHW60_13675 [Caulobacteraceae bacterium]|jgi:hypothetical protein|nr:hypothetical protein [Caulobacteraceae bacterium]
MLKKTLIVFLSALAGMFLLATAANAQATRTWISGVGDDVNPCSRTAPCKTFAGAISKTAAGGEIDTLDPGGFGAVTVTKAMTLADEGAGEAGLLVAGTNAVTVNCVSDPNCTVVIRGLILDGGPIGSNSLNGVRVVEAGTVIIQNCMIRNFTGGSPYGYGVWVNNAIGNSNNVDNIVITDTTISNNGTGGVGSGAGGGIFIQPTGSTNYNVNVTLDRDTIVNNNAGVRVDSSGVTGTGTVNVSINHSNVSQNVNGGLATIGGATASAIMNVSNSTVADNNVGLNASGAKAILRVGTSILTGNVTLDKVQTSAVMTSYGTNQVHDNTNTTALTIAAPQ